MANRLVLIIGAGPTGLVLALWLTKLGAYRTGRFQEEVPCFEQSLLADSRRAVRCSTGCGWPWPTGASGRPRRRGDG